MRQRWLAPDTELRSHDSRDDKHSNGLVGEGCARRASGQLPQVLVFALAEVGSQLPTVLAADEQMLNVGVAPGELVVWSYVIRRRWVLDQTADLIPRPTGARLR